MVSAEKYFSTLVSSVAASQTRWRELIAKEEELFKRIFSAKDRAVLDKLIVSSRGNVQDQLAFVAKVRKHAQFFKEWCDRKGSEELDPEVRNLTNTIFLMFERLPGHMDSLMEKLTALSEVLQGLDSVNFPDKPYVLREAYDAKRIVLERIEDDLMTNQDTVRQLAGKLQSQFGKWAKLQQVASKSAEWAVSVVIHAIGIGLIGSILLSKETMQQEMLDEFGRAFAFSATMTLSTTIFYVLKATVLAVKRIV